MPKRIRKQTVYVVTLDGSIHSTPGMARARLDELAAKALQRRTRSRFKKAKRRSSGPTAIARILGAIHEGAADAKSVHART